MYRFSFSAFAGEAGITADDAFAQHFRPLRAPSDRRSRAYNARAMISCHDSRAKVGRAAFALDAAKVLARAGRFPRGLPALTVVPWRSPRARRLRLIRQRRPDVLCRTYPIATAPYRTKLPHVPDAVDRGLSRSDGAQGYPPIRACSGSSARGNATAAQLWFHQSTRPRACTALATPSAHVSAFSRTATTGGFAGPPRTNRNQSAQPGRRCSTAASSSVGRDPTC